MSHIQGLRIDYVGRLQEVQLWDLEAPRLARKFMGQRQSKNVIRSCFGGVDDHFVVSGSEGTRRVPFLQRRLFIAHTTVRWQGLRMAPRHGPAPRDPWRARRRERQLCRMEPS